MVVLLESAKLSAVAVAVAVAVAFGSPFSVAKAGVCFLLVTFLCTSKEELYNSQMAGQSDSLAERKLLMLHLTALALTVMFTDFGCSFTPTPHSGPAQHAGGYRPHPCGRPFGPTFRRSTSFHTMLS